jgi:hypothetical protein
MKRQRAKQEKQVICATAPCWAAGLTATTPTTQPGAHCHTVLTAAQATNAIPRSVYFNCVSVKYISCRSMQQETCMHPFAIDFTGPAVATLAKVGNVGEAVNNR